jgi:hypothetical protein
MNEHAQSDPSAGVGVVLVRLPFNELDEVAARVVEDSHEGGADVGWRLREHHTLAGRPGVLGGDVVDVELGEWDAVLDESVLIGLHCRVVRWLQQQFRTVGRFGRYDGEPEVVADGDVPALREAEHLGVEGEGCSLVVDEYARQGDSQVVRFPKPQAEVEAGPQVREYPLGMARTASANPGGSGFEQRCCGARLRARMRFGPGLHDIWAADARRMSRSAACITGE